MSDIKTYLELPAEFEQYLSEHDLDLQAFIEQEGIEVNEVGQGPSPEVPKEGSANTRSVVAIILASAGAVLALSSAISRVVKGISDRTRKTVVKVPVRNADGNVVTDAEGNVVFVEEEKLLEVEGRPTDSATIDISKGIIKWSSGEAPATEEGESGDAADAAEDSTGSEEAKE